MHFSYVIGQLLTVFKIFVCLLQLAFSSDLDQMLELHDGILFSVMIFMQCCVDRVFPGFSFIDYESEEIL